ncbi:ATP-binding protein [Amycolatopsis balhimycina DSM 5908]|uniref:ATP-binding protein n=1 Tax=Amycolatopsis balhimycina DSM 5908 TaxID=1081091 RepID=A0A428VXQ7_AMYBA|nr:ATP-binding protein [Amycolatopsis balhimycina]RSM35559.1 ATP-binding protein [Amycolatopsis balhimycina DSM 5908]
MPTPNSPVGDSGNESISGPAARESDVSDLCHPTAPANPAQLALLREEIAAWAARAGLYPDRIPGLQLAVYEAMANVVVHAYPGQLGTFSLLARSHDQSLTVTVADHGRWQPAARPGLLHGRGLPLIHTLADHATIDNGTEGTTVTMTWSR